MTVDSELHSPSTGHQHNDILLESGTNELEVLVFGVGDGVFGVNVAKVREVITPIRPTACPHQPSSVRGVFNLRGKVLPLVDLHHFLKIEAKSDDPAQRRIIVTEFNGQQAAFQVEYVEHIHRMSWKKMKGAPDGQGSSNYAITGITELNGRLVLMLDFESIFDAVSVQKQLHVKSVANDLNVNRSAHHVLIAEDSAFVRDIMSSVLINSGYGNVQAKTNGAEAWETIQQGIEGKVPLPDVIITDIEMPQMDGLALTRNIKGNAAIRHIPVLLFSSLITDDTRHKGQAVGADDQLGKPHLPHLVRIVDGHVAKLDTASPAA